MIKKEASRNVASGPDCVKSSAWKKAPHIIVKWMAQCFSLCLKEGLFPESWKRANLVLIPKGTTSENMPIKARPICLLLLDEVGKAFERIIADRILN